MITVSSVLFFFPITFNDRTLNDSIKNDFFKCFKPSKLTILNYEKRCFQFRYYSLETVN